jgi:acyl-CoA reductase-like NAD-dependent aldehyde dehydrogenase
VYHVPDSGGSTKFGWVVDVFSMDDFEEALNRCNNSALGLHYVQIVA